MTKKEAYVWSLVRPEAGVPVLRHVIQCDWFTQRHFLFPVICPALCYCEEERCGELDPGRTRDALPPPPRGQKLHTVCRKI